ncbi:hypothetical protein RI367_004095 [Sorochytrium milnesiophthora]
MQRSLAMLGRRGGSFFHDMSQSPFALLNDMERLMTHRMNQLFAPPSFSLPTASDASSDSTDVTTQARPHRFLMDVSESDKEYTVKADLPGVPKENVNISLDKDVLTISAEVHNEASNNDKDTRHIVERSYGRFQRVLRLPADADVDNTKASYDNGVLTLTLGKKPEESTTKKIAIE